jgi:hypothetical protein
MRCNNCGWENPDGSQRCEKCNAPLQSGVSYQNLQNLDLHSTIREDKPFEPSHKTTIEETIIEEPQVAQPQPKPQPAPPSDYTGTVNPYEGMGGYVPVVHHCILKPVIFPGEDLRDAPQPINIKGDYNELNRQLLDPNNNTITSKVQATLTNKDGKWYIQNQSVQKTTYVFAEEPVALKTGDIILMGNRTFVFSED